MRKTLPSRDWRFHPDNPLNIYFRPPNLRKPIEGARWWATWEQRKPDNVVEFEPVEQDRRLRRIS